MHFSDVKSSSAQISSQVSNQRKRLKVKEERTETRVQKRKKELKEGRCSASCRQSSGRLKFGTNLFLNLEKCLQVEQKSLVSLMSDQ